MISFFRQKILNQTALNHQTVRMLLTNQQIGLDRFIKQKENNVAAVNKENLIGNIKKSLEGDGFVYTEDLKSLAYSVENVEDTKLLKDAFVKFSSNDESIRLDNFKIGPVICRALFQMDDLDSLKELIEDEKTSQYFQLRSAYNIYLTFLYRKEKYDEMLKYGDKVFSSILSETIIRARADVDRTLVLYLAAANKVGNKDALERSRKLLHEFKEKVGSKGIDRDGRLRLKHIMLYYLICVKNNQFSEALETISQLKKVDHYEFLNAKATILIKLGRTEDCLSAINKILESSGNDRPRYVFTETIEIIKKELESKPNDELKAKIDSLNQDVILDAKIEDTILALPNPSNDGNLQRQRFNQFGGNRQFGANRQFGGDQQYDNRFNQRQNRSFNRFDNKSGFNRFNDRQSNFNNRFNNNRFNDDLGDGSRRPFRPFQTRFKSEESSDFI